MSDIPEIIVSQMDEYHFDTIRHETKLRQLDPFIVNEAKQAVDKIMDKYLNEEFTATKLIWWVLTHPIQDLKVIYYIITIIGVFMNNFLESWRTSIPSVLLLITSALAAMGLSLPADFANIVSMGLIGLILLFTDWKEFTKNLKVYITALVTIIFWILTATHVIMLAPALVTVIIQIIIAIVGMFVAKDQGVTNVIKYTVKKL